MPTIYFTQLARKQGSFESFSPLPILLRELSQQKSAKKKDNPHTTPSAIYSSLSVKNFLCGPHNTSCLFVYNSSFFLSLYTRTHIWETILSLKLIEKQCRQELLLVSISLQPYTDRSVGIEHKISGPKQLERERERGLPLPCNHVKYCQEIFCHERKLQDKTKLLKCYAKHEYKNKLKRNSLLSVDRPKKAKMICWINSQWTVVFIDKMNTGNLISAKTEKYLTKPLHRVVRVFCNWLNYSIGQYAYQTNENNTSISEL